MGKADETTEKWRRQFRNINNKKRAKQQPHTHTHTHTNQETLEVDC